MAGDLPKIRGGTTPEERTGLGPASDSG